MGLFKVAYKYILFLVVAWSSAQGIVYGQYENIWTFGPRAGFDFNSGSPVYISTGMWADEGCASVCDERGQLLFYTEGYNVWNREGNLMPNGKELLGNISNFSFNPTSSTTQGALIIPMPDSANKYYIFSLTSYEVNPPKEANKLYYSVVNIDLNGGLGDVEVARKGILFDSLLTEMMTAIVGDRCNVWLLVAQHYENQLKAYSITAEGLSTQPVVSGLLPANRGFFQGYIEAAPDRKKIAINRIGLGLYDFDPATGKATGTTNLVTVKTPEAGHGGVAFSPDNSKLYASVRDENNRYHLYQFDISSNDSASMVNSKISLGHYFMQAMKRAPDEKIYVCDLALGMGIIEKPNLSGTACQFLAVGQIGPVSWVSVFPNSVAVIKKEKKLTRETLSGNCFANVNPFLMKANNDSAGWDYLWSNGHTGPFQQTDTLGTYWVSYRTAPCNLHVDTFKVLFPNGVLPYFNIQPSCKDNKTGKVYAYTYPGDTVTYHYLWRNNSGEIVSDSDTLGNVLAGTYIVNIRTRNCDTSLSIFIPEQDYKVSFNADSIICKGDTIVFENTSENHFTTFHWDFGDSTSSSLLSPRHIYAAAGNYNVRLIGVGATCGDTAYLSVVVDSPVLSFFQAAPDSICQGQPVTFMHELVEASVSKLTWDFGDNVASVINDQRLEHAYEIPGIMPVTLNARFRACPDQSFTDTVYVFELPKVDLGTDNDICFKGNSIVLMNLAQNPDKYHSRWNTGDHTSSITIKHPGVYSLTLSDSLSGCSTTESIAIKKDCFNNIPNAFSPNGDGINDYFYPRQLLSQGVEEFTMRIHNRWGQLVFETSVPDGKGWDGRYNGREQPEGTYVYYIDLVIADKRERYQGNVTLIR